MTYLAPEGDPQYAAEPAPPAWQPPAPSPPAPPARGAQPGAGWALLGAGVLIAIAALLPWASFFGVSVNGTSGDGRVTVLGAVVIALAGLLIGLRRGLLWIAITAFLFSALVTITGLIDVNDIRRIVNSSGGFLLESGVSVGSGLWLTVAGGMLGLVFSTLAMMQTQRRRSR